MDPLTLNLESTTLDLDSIRRYNLTLAPNTRVDRISIEFESSDRFTFVRMQYKSFVNSREDVRNRSEILNVKYEALGQELNEFSETQKEPRADATSRKDSYNRR